MFKRVLLILALGGALAACSPTGSGSSTGVETLAPIESTLPTEAPSDGLPTEAPSDGLPTESPLASPS
jgi:hypothetical protein